MRPASRLAPLALGTALLALGAALCLRDAAHRRADVARAAPVRRAAARVVGAELALHSASRWLRHPTRAEPWAAFSDGPALLDTDPAVAPPPVGVFRSYGATVRRR